MADWKYLNASDIVSGCEGTLYAEIDGSTYAIAECKSINASISKNKSEIKVIGYRGVQHKAMGWNGTGSLTVAYVTSRWAKMLVDYANGKEDIYFTLKITNNDVTANPTIGMQIVTLGDVNIDSGDISKLDAEADILDETYSFTFSTVSMTGEGNETGFKDYSTK